MATTTDPGHLSPRGTPPPRGCRRRLLPSPSALPPFPPCHPCPLAAAAQVEKHWSEKALEDMNERDWRIFREDFNIGYRGVNTVLPIRSWDEAKLPTLLRQVLRGKRAACGCGCGVGAGE